MTVAESGSPKYTAWNVAILAPRGGRGEQAGRHQAGDQDALADGPVQRFKGMNARIRSIRMKYACGDQFFFFFNLRNCSRGDATCGLTSRKPGVCKRVLAGPAGDGRHELLERVEWMAVEQREDGPAGCISVYPNQGL